MGRYDKIRIWNGSSWYQPSQMKVRALLKQIRYIYIYQNGSTANTGNHLCHVEAWSTSGVNVAIGKTVTAGGPSGVYCYDGANAVKASLDSTYAETFKDGSWFGGSRTYFCVDLGQGYDLDSVKVWRYYPDGRTYYESAICVVDINGIETRLHEYSQQPLYAESSSGFEGKWIDLGANDSANTRPLHVWNGSWIRKTLNRQVNYGDKQWNVSASGTGATIGADYIGANVNQNKFNFYFYCMKDYDNDKTVANYGDTNYGWNLVWLTDGRMRWRCYYSGNYSQSYSSNYRKANNWSVVNAYRNSTGTGNGTLNFGGTTSSISCGNRHQAWRSISIGSWGMCYRDTIRLYGINSGGSYVDKSWSINSLTVKSGSQTLNNLALSSNNTVTQDTSISWV